MTTRASGTFDVTLSPQPAADTSLGRITLDKRSNPSSLIANPESLILDPGSLI